MITGRRWTRTLLVLAGLAFGAAFASPADAVIPNCALIGGTGPDAGPCTVAVSFTVAAPSPINIGVSVIIKTGATLTIPPAASPFTLDVIGDFSMEPASAINGNNNANPGHGADITVNATGNILLAGGTPGAIIMANHAPALSCTTGSRGGNIALNADSDNDFDGAVKQDDGSRILSIAACGLGQITITGKDIDLDGEVRSEGTKTTGVGGPITVNAKCKLNISVTGEVISLGHDPGADLVHLQGGCDVKILGLVASTGAGHFRNPKNRCDSSNAGAPIRPGKPNNSNACVEIWSGGPMLIDRIAGNGEVNADVGFSGGPEGLGWIELFAVLDITIKGDPPAAGGACAEIFFTNSSKLPTYNPCFAVHANQGAPGVGGITGGFGGLVRIASSTGSVIASGLAVQTTDTANGGKGGRPVATTFCTTTPCGGITIDGDQNVDLSGATVQSKGAANGAGGQVDVRAFTLAILADLNSKIDVTGGTPPNGVVNLTACTTIAFPPGVVVPVAATKTTGICGAHPIFPAYVDTQPFPGLGPFPTVTAGGVKGCPSKCGGDCQCVGSFKLLTSPANTVELKGFNLNSTTKVRLSTASCDTTTGIDTPFSKVGAPPDTTLRFSVPGGLPSGDYHIITESGFNVCCTLDTIHLP